MDTLTMNYYAIIKNSVYEEYSVANMYSTVPIF